VHYILIPLIFMVSIPANASDWPLDLSQSVFDRCRRVGGESQCQCVVIRLQQKFTFEDMRLTTRNKLARESLNQMLRAFNVKCLGKEYKERTLALKNQQAPKSDGARRFR
jgi:hypothetical protein